jgi:hypothetical protein
MYGDYLCFTCLSQRKWRHISTENTPQDISISNTHIKNVVLEGPVMSETMIKRCVKDSLFLNTEWFISYKHNCRDYFLGFCYERIPFKHMSDCELLRIYDRFEPRIEGKDY